MSPESFKASSPTIRQIPPKQTVLIIGAGHFGKRAALCLGRNPDRQVIVIDKDRDRLEELREMPVERIHRDGVRFLADRFSFFPPESFIVPAVPMHFAFHWLKVYLSGDYWIKQIEVPKRVRPIFPFAWTGSEGSLLVSYADFPCPDDCPEPAGYCTVTGERREIPLYGLLSETDLPGFGIHVVRSQQLAPGVGGYMLADLERLWKSVMKAPEKSWILGTACRCHGIMTALKMVTV